MPSSALDDPPPFLSTQVDWRGMADTAVMLVLCASWLGLLGRLHWVLDLVSHFRWQHLACAVLAVLWSLWQGRRIALVCSLLTLLLNALLIGKLALPSEVTALPLAPDFRLRVLSFNVLTSNPNTSGVLQYLQAAEADVILLMEVNAEWESALQPLRQSHPHGLSEPQEDNFGLSLYSRLPLDSLGLEYLAHPGVPSIIARLKHQGRELAILCTHPVPPSSAEDAKLRDDQLRHIALRAKGLPVPLLVMGDLNVTPWSHGMSLVQADKVLGYRSLTPAWQPTWYGSKLMAIPIDHLLCTAPLVIETRSIGPELGSDHRPVLAELRWAEP